MPTNDTKILIIGAGVAGIACATKLIENGFTSVYIIESQSYIGGRINTVPFADNVIDLGAQWCHGETNNVVYELANKNNLLDTSGDIYVNCQAIRSNGEVVPDKMIDRFKNTLFKILSQREDQLKVYRGSLNDYLTEKFYAELNRKENSDLDKNIAREFFENFRRIESSESSGHIQEVSAIGFDEFWECEGDYLLNWKDKGYFELLKLLMKVDDKNPLNGILTNKIFTEITVEQIDWQCEDASISLKCQNLEEPFQADHVVLTVSLGVLKERFDKMFNPSLPQDKIIPIKSLGYGNVTKIFLEFPSAFWPQNWSGFSTLWSEKDSAKIRKSDEAWIEDIYGFYCVNYQPRVLLAWIVGSSAHLVETLSESEITKSCMHLLHRFLPSWTIPDPVNIAFSKWRSNPSFRGAYSFRSMQTEKHIGATAKKLAEPLTVLAYTTLQQGEDSNESMRRLRVKPVVQFAGEATSEHYYSTVHGAVESGWREAERLINYYDYHND